MTATTGGGFGTALRRLRLAAGLTQDMLAERAGVSARAVSDLERDAARVPRLDTVNLLADALHLAPEQRSELLSAARPASPARQRAVAPGIPRPLDALIGRDAVTAEVCELVERAGVRLLTLTGPGGVGKTRIALEAAARAAADFADGAVFVDLSPLRDSDLVIPALASAFGLGEHDGVPAGERLTAVLRSKRCLLVLDNFEHLLGARPALIALLTACPDVVALVTSRVALRLRGESEYRVAPLEVSAGDTGQSPAAQLFAERARAVGVELADGDQETVAGICRRLEGLPLAIELAAARLRLLSPHQLACRLEPRLPLLTLGPDDLPDRQRTMRDAIAWSYRLLPERARGLFLALSVFAGGWTMASAQAVRGDPALDEDLTVLVDASLVLVRRTETAVRFTMMETIREFAHDQLADAAEAEATLRRHAEYFVTLAESEPDGLARELDNLRAALRWSIERQEADTALRLCGAMWRFWSDQGHLAEGLGWVRSALALPGAVGAAGPARIAALTGAATMAINSSAFDEAAQVCERLMVLARREGSARDVIVALITRGLLARRQDRYADAASDYDEALILSERSGDVEGHAQALIGLSYVAFLTGDPRAQQLAEEGLSATRATGNRRDLGDALLSLGMQAVHAGDLARTEELAAEAVTIFRELRDIRNTAEGLRAVGTAAAMRQDYGRATPLLEQSLALYRESGDERVYPQVLAHIGFVALNTGDLTRARRLCVQAHEAACRYSDQWAIAMTTVLMGHADLAMGKIESAHACFRESAAMLRAIGNPLYLSWCLEGLAGAAAARGRCQIAAQLCAARDALLASLSAVLPAAHLSGYRRTLDTIERELDASDAAAAREAARGVSLEALLAAAR
jgi:predicted ATPase/DNA-binding XRE family transcriptional regulator